MAEHIRTDSEREVFLGPDELIITKTDPTGHITYANRVFMRLVDYSEKQLLGRPHNIIRHPDMPRGAFRLMWKTLQAGNEFFAVVKNYTASRSYYWVLANITPDTDINGRLQGYFSVRRQAGRSAVETIKPVYAEMLRIEQATDKASAPDASMNWLLQQLAGQGSDYESFILKLYAGQDLQQEAES
ncbi:PAS domain-containing protein [Paludibacterium yongneupense]|uniref:PAS domain-containing protein n=1 Tax=Paludibacterium yongneupense TaxID=400061 RepID=UPI0003F969B8|nr:PAS domain-containing protein [Paludibacterium yongneupense]